MSLILSGTDGLSDVDGTAATPAIRGTDANTGIFFPAADTIAFAEGGVECARFDSSGNFGIGTSSPACKLDIVTSTAGAFNTRIYNSATTGNSYAQLQLQTDAGNFYIFKQNSTNTTNAGVGSTALYADGAYPMVFYTNAQERMRIDSSGNLGIGTTSPAQKLDVYLGTTGTVGQYLRNTTINLLSKIDGTTAAQFGTETSHPLTFITGNTERARIDTSGRLLLGTTTVGTDGPRITVANSNNSQTWQLGTIAAYTNFYVYNNSSVGVYITNGGTSWSSSSDERVKDIIEPIENAITKVSALRAVIGKYKTDEEGTRRSFLIAQDVQAVFPEAINVQENEQGTLGLQYTEIIPLLVAAIKEQSTLITQLTDRITALESA